MRTPVLIGTGTASGGRIAESVAVAVVNTPARIRTESVVCVATGSLAVCRKALGPTATARANDRMTFVSARGLASRPQADAVNILSANHWIVRVSKTTSAAAWLCACQGVPRNTRECTTLAMKKRSIRWTRAELLRVLGYVVTSAIVRYTL